MYVRVVALAGSLAVGVVWLGLLSLLVPADPGSVLADLG